MSISGRFKNAWNAFTGRDPTFYPPGGFGFGGRRPDRYYMRAINYRSIISTIFNQIAIDCAAIDINHVRLDENGNYMETIRSDLNRALTKEANVDQTGRELILDAVISMMDEGVVGIVPVRASKNPRFTSSYKIYELRTAKILEWYPNEVLIEVYDEDTGKKTQIRVEKRIIAIISNPFYEIMNEPNSTHQRLINTLGYLDRSNDQVTSNKLNMILQYPYQIKSKARRILADQRKEELETQMSNSPYGIAWTDGTEKIIQLNRSLENNLWEQAKSLNEDLFNQMGLSRAVFDGTANEQQMLNYYNRTIEPILSAIVENMERKWISLTAESQNQAIRFFRNPFKLVPVGQIAEIADKFTRNEIMTSNEIRAIIGKQPAKDPEANLLLNSNLNRTEEDIQKKLEEQQQNIQNQ